MKPSLQKERSCTRVLDLPLLFVLYFNTVLRCVVGVREAELASLDALLDCFVELEDVNAALAARASQQVQGGVEHDSLDVSFAVTTLQLLDAVTAICAEQLDDVASATG